MRAILTLALVAAIHAACDGAGSEPPANGDRPAATRTAGRGEASPATTPETAQSPVGAQPGECAPPPNIEPPLASVFCANARGMDAARVVRIIDGDTLVVTLDGSEESVRLFGIDAAERGEQCYVEAATRLEDLAADVVLLLPDERDRDRFGRLLRYVYTPAGLSIDAVLISEGLALAWKEDGALRDDLVSLEVTSRQAGRGCLWPAP